MESLKFFRVPLRPTLPSEIPQREIEDFRLKFSLIKPSCRREAMLSLTNVLRRAGGICQSSGDGDSVTFFLQAVEPSMLLSEQLAMYRLLVNADQRSNIKNARLMKLHGLRCLWLAFRCRGIRYADEAVTAFKRALIYPNHESEHTPFRINDWLLKAQFLKSISEGDAPAMVSIVAELNSTRLEYPGANSIFECDLTPSLLLNELKNECMNNGRFADDSDFGQALLNRICRDVLGVDLGGVFLRGGLTYRPQVVDAGDASGTGAIICYDETEEEDPLLVGYAESNDDERYIRETVDLAVYSVTRIDYVSPTEPLIVADSANQDDVSVGVDETKACEMATQTITSVAGNFRLQIDSEYVELESGNERDRMFVDIASKSLCGSIFQDKIEIEIFQPTNKRGRSNLDFLFYIMSVCEAVGFQFDREKANAYRNGCSVDPKTGYLVLLSEANVFGPHGKLHRRGFVAIKEWPLCGEDVAISMTVRIADCDNIDLRLRKLYDAWLSIVSASEAVSLNKCPDSSDVLDGQIHDVLTDAIVELRFKYTFVTRDELNEAFESFDARYHALVSEYLSPFCTERFRQKHPRATDQDAKLVGNACALKLLLLSDQGNTGRTQYFEDAARVLAEELRKEGPVAKTIAYARLIQYNMVLIRALEKGQSLQALVQELLYLKVFLQGSRHVNEAVEQTIWTQFLLYSGRISDARMILDEALLLRGSCDELNLFSYVLALAENNIEKAAKLRNRLSRSQNAALKLQVDRLAAWEKAGGAASGEDLRKLLTMAQAFTLLVA